MDFNWIDWSILAVVGIGVLFGLLWGTLRMLFFAISLGVTFALLPVTLPPINASLSGFLGESNNLNAIKPLIAYSIAIFVPFVIASVLLAWPHGVIAKRLNPFINYGVGAMLGFAIGYILMCFSIVIYAAFSEDQPRPVAFCDSIFAPYVFAGTQPLMTIVTGQTANMNPDLHEYTLNIARLVAQADPDAAATCGAIIT